MGKKLLNEGALGTLQQFINEKVKNENNILGHPKRNVSVILWGQREQHITIKDMYKSISYIVEKA